MDHTAGFTLIEVVIVIALIMILGTTAGIFSIDSYARSVCHSERDTLASLLYRVRSRAMNNMNHEPQGLHFENDKYVLFSGDFYNSGDPFNESINRSSTAQIFSSTSSPEILPRDIIFDQLTGNVDNTEVGNIFIGNAYSVCRDIIHINSEGGIDW